MEQKIVYIPIENLVPHPDNPRKEIGDVTELAESIKAKGVLQNLTVVPDVRLTAGHYFILIGHRRHAAAKLAGLTELPCVVVDMSLEDQIATMLVENMQRSDLTIYEQAKGFQMMLDLGKTVQDVSEMSGFSETTVRRRAKLAELDEKKFKKAVDRGATLFDFAELDKIEDPEVRNEVLGSMGTASWKNKLEAAINEQAAKKDMARWEEQASRFATKLDSAEWVSGEKYGYIGDKKIRLEYFQTFNRWSGKGKDIEKPKLDAEWYFVVNNSDVTLYKKWKRDVEAERLDAERREEADKHRALAAQLEEISERHRKLRLDFVKKFGAYKQKNTAVLEFCTEAMIYAQRNGGGYYDSNTALKGLAEMMEIEYKEVHGSVELDWNDFLSEKLKNPERTAMITALWILDKGSFFTDGYDSAREKYVLRYQDNPELDKLYMMLGSLGYVSSPEEVEMRHGTHKLQLKEQEAE